MVHEIEKERQSMSNFLRKFKPTAFTITVYYLLFTSFWFVTSDYFIMTVFQHTSNGYPSKVIFGAVYIIVSSLMLFFLLHNWQKRLVSVNRLLSTIIDIAPIRIFWKDKELNYMGCNTAFAKDAGENTPADIIGKNDYQLGWKEQAEIYRADDRQVLEAKRAKLNFEEPQTTPNGEEIWLRTSKVPLTDPDNEVIGVLGLYDDISERKKIELALHREKNTAQNYLDIVGVMILVLDNDRKVRMINRYGCDIIGYPAEEVIGKNWIEHFIPEHARQEVDHVGDTLKGPKNSRINYFENPILTKKGEERLIAWRNTPLFDEDGNTIGILTSGEDITEWKQAEKDSRKSRQWLQSIITNEPECVKLVDADGRLAEMNPAGLAMLEAETLSVAQNRLLTDYLLPEWRAAFIDLHQRVMKGESGKLEFEIEGLKGTRRWLETHAAPMRDDEGNITMLLGITRDITERKHSEEKIHYLANFDPLTDLPNRFQMHDHFQYTLHLAKRNERLFAVMFLDLDHFKEVNDSLGHSYGDLLLKEISKRLKSVIREEDTLARLGGDEFILLLPDTDSDGAAQVAQKLLETIVRPTLIDGHELTITTSIGIAVYPADGSEMETLLKNADSAMYRAKQEGRNSYSFFTEEMQKKSTRNLQLTNALRNALEDGELSLVYQPQISLSTQQIIGAEALLRWNSSEFGPVSPAEFIPLAENSGLILSIGEWVLRTAVRQMKHWIDQGFEPIIMAVNLSAAQFRHGSLPKTISQILKESGLPPEYLEIELTESVAMYDPQKAIQVMEELYEQGIRMSIDDFGTGYSSLNYLKKFKVYKLKIDQSFVRDINTDAEDRAIVSTIIGMAKHLGLQTIAEGVETAGQIEYLRKEGCDELQGYHYSKPLTAEEFETYRRNYSADASATV